MASNELSIINLGFTNRTRRDNEGFIDLFHTTTRFIEQDFCTNNTDQFDSLQTRCYKVICENHKLIRNAARSLPPMLTRKLFYHSYYQNNFDNLLKTVYLHRDREVVLSPLSHMDVDKWLESLQEKNLSDYLETKHKMNMVVIDSFLKGMLHSRFEWRRKSLDFEDFPIWLSADIMQKLFRFNEAMKRSSKPLTPKCAIKAIFDLSCKDVSSMIQLLNHNEDESKFIDVKISGLLFINMTNDTSAKILKLLDFIEPSDLRVFSAPVNFYFLQDIFEKLPRFMNLSSLNFSNTLIGFNLSLLRALGNTLYSLPHLAALNLSNCLACGSLKTVLQTNCIKLDLGPQKTKLEQNENCNCVVHRGVLKVLKLRSTRINNMDSSSIAEFSIPCNLMFLDLGSSILSDFTLVLNSITNITSLKYLNLSSCFFDDEGINGDMFFPQISKLINLEVLDLNQLFLNQDKLDSFVHFVKNARKLVRLCLFDSNRERRNMILEQLKDSDCRINWN